MVRTFERRKCPEPKRKPREKRSVISRKKAKYLERMHFFKRLRQEGICFECRRKVGTKELQHGAVCKPCLRTGWEQYALNNKEW